MSDIPLQIFPLTAAIQDQWRYFFGAFQWTYQRCLTNTTNPRLQFTGQFDEPGQTIYVFFQDPTSQRVGQHAAFINAGPSKKVFIPASQLPPGTKLTTTDKFFDQDGRVQKAESCKLMELNQMWEMTFNTFNVGTQ